MRPRPLSRRSRGQLSVEALVLLGAVLLLGILLFTYADDAVSDMRAGLAASQARLALSRTADAATRVYRQGAGSLDTVWLLLPQGTRSFSAGNSTLFLELDAGTAMTLYESLPFEVNGSLPGEAGLRKLRLDATPEGVVLGVAP